MKTIEKSKEILDADDMANCLEVVSSFIENENFKALLKELHDSSPNFEGRKQFVKNVILNKGELKKRGIVLPSDLIIQRSKFDDKRPTLFCVTKYMKDRSQKVTFTFDNGVKY